ncbi:mastin-like isoform X2 [Clavelina lepadiformis]|uniref:Peptidase S1 domain-containing protein n=1 Tax=Clavelina lepadiformis TaxID=159417 RepID=A0ABP0GPU4_CLALP
MAHHRDISISFISLPVNPSRLPLGNNEFKPAGSCTSSATSQTSRTKKKQCFSYETKSLVAAAFVGIAFAAVCFTAVFVGPCIRRSTHSRRRPRIFNFSQDAYASYDNETRSRPYGFAGGVKHFIFGDLPTMNESRLTEPNSSEALYLQYECGKSSKIFDSGTNFTLGLYEPAQSSAFPWLVRIVAKQNTTADDGNASWNEVGICGAVLIRPLWVMTARHCYEDDGFRRTVVAYGPDGHVSRSTEHDRLIGYPGYDDVFNQHDVLLIKLKDRLALTEMPLCLPNLNVIPETGRICMYAGWSGGDVDSSAFMEMWVEIEDPTKCQSRYCGLKYDVNNNICDRKISTDTPNATSGEICHGLSGSPLMCHEHGRWVSYGILNWSGPNCDLTAGRGYALLSTRMSWICDQVEVPDWPPCKAL